MNSVERELHGYINGTENMSGFDSYDDDLDKNETEEQQ